MAGTEALTLESIRDNARVKLKGICGVYRTCDGAEGRICQGHSYGSPIGMGGTGSGASFANNVEALKALRFKEKLSGPDIIPDTGFEFFGKRISMPVMGARRQRRQQLRRGIGDNGTRILPGGSARLQGRGDDRMEGGDSFNYSIEHPYGIEAISEALGLGVQIIKPREQKVIMRFFEKAEKAGCIAVGVDLDGCGSYAMNKHNQPVFHKTPMQLREIVKFTSLPVIFKGIMSAEDAEKCVEAGASAIVASNHGGRVLDHTPGVAEILPEIFKAAGPSCMIIADGGIRNGYDALKMLALGADAVLAGRDIVRAAVGGGIEGVALQMRTLGEDLVKAMKMTGCSNLEDISRDILAA